MLVAFARNQTLVARKGTNLGTSVIWTDPHPIGEWNYCHAALNVPVLFTQNLGTCSLTAEAYGSIDGLNWFQVPSISIVVTAPTEPPSEGANYVTSAFLRFKITLAMTATLDDDLAVATFDLHANLTRK